MQFIPEREHMKAGKYVGLASPWDFEKGGCVCGWCECVCITDLNILSFEMTNFFFPLHSFACLAVSFQVCLPKKV